MSTYEKPAIGMSAAAVPCPRCGAKAGEPCHSAPSGRITYTHVGRTAALQGTARRCSCFLHYATRPPHLLQCACECDHTPDEERWAA